MTLFQIGLSSNFCIRLRINGSLGYFHVLAIVNSEFTGEYRYLYNADIAFSLDKCPKTGLLWQFNFKFLLRSLLFSVVALSIHIPTKTVQISFFTSLPAYYWLAFVNFELMGGGILPSFWRALFSWRRMLNTSSHSSLLYVHSP